MSEDLFRAERAKHTRGSLTVTMKDGAKLAKKLEKLKDGGETAIKRTVSDFTTRAPGWVSKGIRQHYGVDTKAIEEAQGRTKRGSGATRIRVRGFSVDGASLEYKGRTLTPIHFKMSPKSRPTDKQAKKIMVPGQAIAKGSPVAMVRPPKKYTVKATILKGNRVSMKPGTFIAEGKGGVSLPYQRTGEGRTPIEAIRTLSVPQMIGNEEHQSRARDTISKLISENLEKRFEHHVQQAMK